MFLPSLMGVPMAESGPRGQGRRQRKNRVFLKKTVFLLETSVNSQKKRASRLDETTGRCLTLERKQRFF